MTTETAPSPAAPWVPSDSTFAARLAMIRHRMGWNIKEAAQACGVPHTTWRLWELDHGVPRNHVVVAKQIAGAAGCDYTWLLLGPEGAGSRPTGGYFSNDRLITVGGRPSSSGPRGPVSHTRPIAGAAARPAPVRAR